MMAMAKSSIEPPPQQYLAGQAITTTGESNEGWVPHSSPVFGLEWDTTALNRSPLVIPRNPKDLQFRY
jgi:hypothetical protein